ncbi:MAG: flagellar hook-associated protein FlgK [Giesbergeria sp.]|nr:flagellar hook-associated protein FlgK [Giesbergeria sp.]
MSLLNVGARALLANQVALQTAGHNIANVSTPGYSRQNVVLETVQGQFTGGGYIGKGVNVATILRNHSELLTRQAASAGAVSSADTARAIRLNELQDVFSGGATGLGAAINDMVNAFSDVVTAPTDLAARSLVLTRIDETAGRMRAASARLDEIQSTVRYELTGAVQEINKLAKGIAAVNEQIARAQGNGQSPNDLLDQRDTLIRNLNNYVQTSQIPASDGTVGIFVAGSQPLVLGNVATPLSIGDSSEFAGSGKLKLYFNNPGSAPIELNEDMLGGGEVAGLLRFHNGDLAEGRNLLGRMAVAISETMNAQHKLGVTLDGQVGGNLFTPVTLPDARPGLSNTSGATIGLAVSDPTLLAASNYRISYSAPGVGSVQRESDGKTFQFGPALPPPGFATVGDFFATQGLSLTITGAPAANDQFLVNPLQSAATDLKAMVYSPRDLAAANPVNVMMGPNNSGKLQMAELTARSNPPGATAPITLTFTGPNTYTRSDTGATSYGYISGQPITYDSATPPTGWSITLNGTPDVGDTVTIDNALAPAYGDQYKRNAGNAGAMLDLRDVKMFDESTMADGYASAMAQIGTRTQSAQFAAKVSEGIAAQLEQDRTAVSGVNLDEEAARLIQYQQAYQASAKMIQIAQSIFDSLIQTMGR